MTMPRGKQTWIALLAGFGTVLAACAPAAPAAPTQAPAAKAPQPAATTQPAAQTAAKPAAKTEVITAATGFVKDDGGNDGFWEFQKRVEQKSGGSLKIDWKGGPEAVPSLEGMDNLRRGVIDMINTAPGYYSQLAPGSTSFINLLHGKGAFKGIRDAGVFELLAKEHEEKAGVKLLGATTGGFTFNLYTRKPISKVSDFKGMKVRTTPQYVPLLEGLGASPVTTAPGEVYTAMERGVVEAFGWPRGQLEAYKLQEVVCCMVEPGFYSHWNLLSMNLQAWNRLSQEHQKMIEETIQEVEAWAPKHFWANSDAEVQKNGKYTVTQLPEAEGKALREMAYAEGWKKWSPVAPDMGDKIKALADKTGIADPWPVIRPQP